MSEITFGASPTADAHVEIAREPFFSRIWPPAAIAFGIGLTAAWTCLLAYGLVKLVELAI